MNAVNMNWNRHSPINMSRADMKFAMIGWGPICGLLMMNEQFMNGQLMICEWRLIMQLSLLKPIALLRRMQCSATMNMWM